MSDTQSTGTYEANSVQVNIDSTAVAETSLVHCTASDVHCTTNMITTETRSVETTQDNNIPSQSGSVQPECMAAIDKQFGSKGFSKKVRELLSASWRKGTQKDYACKFKQFSCRCSARKIDPYAISLSQFADFLADLFKKGLKYRTIAGYRSMLSSVLLPVQNIPFGQHPYIIRLLKGVFNSRPPTAALIPEWDLPKVLDLLKNHLLNL